MKRVIENVRIDVRILSSVINLNLVRLVNCRFPVVGRIAVPQCGHPDKYSRVVVGKGRPPVYSENKVVKLFARVPEQPYAVDRLDDVGTKFHEPAKAGHLPAVETATAQRSEPWLDRQRFSDDCKCRPTGQRNRGERGIC